MSVVKLLKWRRDFTASILVIFHDVPHQLPCRLLACIGKGCLLLDDCTSAPPFTYCLFLISYRALQGDVTKRIETRVNERKRVQEEPLESRKKKKVSLPKRQRSYLSYDDDERSSSDSEIDKTTESSTSTKEVENKRLFRSQMFFAKLPMSVHILTDESKDKTTESSTSTKEVENKKPTTKKRQDIASDALKAYQMRVLPGDKLIYDYMDVLDYKRDEAPYQLDKEIKAVNFTKGRTIDKFLVNCEEGVMQFLDKFKHIRDLESLGRCLGEILINYSTASNDLIYVQHLLQHFYFLYKNDTLLQAISEREYGHLY
ncbi:10425_t:CDS:2 [Rhizophagus irregularis]|nr:10425_t:CDS:2 [Rhizophagus irregularis]